MRFDELRVGTALPPLAIPITVQLIAGGAIATRDYFAGHYDKVARETAIVAEETSLLPSRMRAVAMPAAAISSSG